MLYKNYLIWIQRKTTKEKNSTEGDWEAFINENFYHLNCHNLFNSWGLCISDTSPKNVYELAKMEIELEEMKALKRKMDKSVAKILLLDCRNNRHKQI